MKLDLLNNANSYIEESLKKSKVAVKNDHDWKYAILNIVQAIELVLKERLRKEYPLLIFDNIDKPVNTVSLEKAVDRLIKILGLNISNDDINNIRLAKEWRNSLTHYECEIDPATMKIVFVKLFAFYKDFNEKYLDRSIKDFIDKDIWDEVFQYYDYSREIGKRALATIKEKKYTEVIHCNICFEETFITDEGINECLTCGHKENVITCDGCWFPIFETENNRVELGIVSWSNDSSQIGKPLIKNFCENCYNDFLKSELVE
jgi:hypothetical protein